MCAATPCLCDSVTAAVVKHGHAAAAGAQLAPLVEAVLTVVSTDVYVQTLVLRVTQSMVHTLSHVDSIITLSRPSKLLSNSRSICIFDYVCVSLSL